MKFRHLDVFAPDPILYLNLAAIFHFNRTSYTTMAPNMSLFTVNAILILATDDSSRILAKCS